MDSSMGNVGFICVYWSAIQEYFFYSIVTVDLATAKDLLLLANTVDEQKQWVQNLSNKIEYRSSANSTGMRASKK